MILHGSSRRRPLQDKAQSIANRKSRKYTLYPVSVQTPPTPAPLFFSGRAGNACTNLLGYLVRYVRTRGMVEIAESGKTADFRHATLPHTLATHGSCD